jgi:hypothetical protein
LLNFEKIKSRGSVPRNESIGRHESTVNEKLSDGRHKQPRIAGLKVVNHKKLHD